MGEEGYLGLVYAAFEAGQVTEDEWRQADRGHRFVLLVGDKAAS